MARHFVACVRVGVKKQPSGLDAIRETVERFTAQEGENLLLPRSVAFINRPRDSRVEFAACESSHANRMTIQITAVMAEQEARFIQDRTVADIAALKQQSGMGLVSLCAWKALVTGRRNGSEKSTRGRSPRPKLTPDRSPGRSGRSVRRERSLPGMTLYRTVTLRRRCPAP